MTAKKIRITVDRAPEFADAIAQLIAAAIHGIDTYTGPDRANTLARWRAAVDTAHEIEGTMRADAEL